MSEVWSNEQVKFRDMDVVTEHSKAGQIHNIGIPVKLKENPGEIKSAAPILGENTREILSEIGYSNKEVNDFIQSQVVSENK
jgi:crotonobetainyl-CoA:carnitine CoA-transferase CaiB-like acyl-CoA transferase